MSEIKEAQRREDMDPAYQWDLSSIYASDEDFEADLANFSQALDRLAPYQGHLHEGEDQVIAALELLLEISRRLEVIYVYAHLKHDQDTTNAKYLDYNKQASALLTEVSSALSWFEPEVLALDDEALGRLAEREDYGQFFKELRDQKAHVLDPDLEEALAAAGEIFSSPGRIFSMINNADLTFEPVERADGQTISLTHGSYGRLLEHSDRNLRRQAFHNLYQGYEGLIHTLAENMSNNVKSHNYKAKLRHYDSARQSALAQNHIPEAVYDRLVEKVNDHLGDFHDYLNFRKDQLALDKMQMYDLYTPLAGQAPISFTFEEAKDLTKKALAPLGQTYLADLDQAFEEGWIDVYENIGKRSGAYSSGAYDTKPYVLLNWQDSLSDVYTLVHELGHSMHSYYTRKHQAYVYGDYSIFLAEIASTTNENLLTEYLLATVEDPATRIYILNQYLDSVKGTLFRQTQFAEFEQWMHEAAASGRSLTAETLNQAYFELNQRYYGSAVDWEDKTIAMEWARIPHFYYNFYVYQYATGFSAANSLADRISRGEEGAVSAYLAYLSAGSSDYPIAVMQRAGVDMTQGDYLDSAFDQFKSRLAELKQLMSE
ncbi:oligoendopeptidase F [Aerococcus sp. HMSC072A12]|uniref:Oligopeptidase F n=1 Tax=Aerococcus sanguinicola TaxID=119206 RepID=A0A5N1GQ39_9LACT|nr:MULTISPECIES: oligoendopeptidase F [Aerococcus]KAA9302161.1 oligoendopeptidase F [Aerococcus sanguinicola]MDK6368408.1 oligoendopeptidase F [Aerococcus sp. UMB9870]MDK6686335.1 oligoendopeptidase F [Aerococcus sp. UMB8623]MDK6941043.1 oligoendopeptidase F [Aerococcus sp. UMB8487]OFK21089.1 oligoendopeptidase F [Aerococcus sp. HMSC072A12]